MIGASANCSLLTQKNVQTLLSPIPSFNSSDSHHRSITRSNGDYMFSTLEVSTQRYRMICLGLAFVLLSLAGKFLLSRGFHQRRLRPLKLLRFPLKKPSFLL